MLLRNRRTSSAPSFYCHIISFSPCRIAGVWAYGRSITNASNSALNRLKLTCVAILTLQAQRLCHSKSLRNHRDASSGVPCGKGHIFCPPSAPDKRPVHGVQERIIEQAFAGVKAGCGSSTDHGIR